MRYLVPRQPISFLVLGVVFLVACAPMRYSDYDGKDPTSLFGAWPTTTGTMAERGHAIPVYRGWPSKPYEVIGSVRLENPNQTWDEGDFAGAARQGKKRGGDAIVIRRGSEFGVSKIVGANDNAAMIASSYTSALVIRWLSDRELSNLNAKTLEFWNDYGLRHPDLSLNQETLDLAKTHVARSGFSTRSPDSYWIQVENTLTKVGCSNPASIEGYWIFKASISASSAVSGEEKRDFLGIALGSALEKSIVFVSKEGEVELNFNGVIENGKLIGQLGLGPFPAKCEGAITADKISISFQAISPDGLVHGNVVLQRIIHKAQKL